MLSLSFNNKDNLKFTMFMERKRGNFDGVRIGNYVHKEGFPFAALFYFFPETEFSRFYLFLP